MRKSLLVLMAMACAFALHAQSNMIERQILGTGGQITDTLDNGTIITLDLSTDDAEQENFTVDSRFDDDLDAGWEGDPADQNILNLGLRFRNLPLLQGSTIDSAFIILHAHEGKTQADVCELTITAEATDNSSTFDANNFNDMNLFTDKPTTSAEVSWTVAEDWTIWQPYSTPDLSSIVQEIVNRPGWSAGNAISFFLFGEDQGPSIVENAREFTSFENIADPDDQDPQGNPGDGTNHPEWRPKLVVYVNGPVATEDMVERPVRVYPNPVNQGKVRLALSSDEPAQIVLVNVYGQNVRNFESAGEMTDLNLEGLNSGVYFINITQGRKTHSKKIIIE